MTGTDLCVRLYKSVPVIFEPPCTYLCIMLKNDEQINKPSLRTIWNKARRLAYSSVMMKFVTTYLMLFDRDVCTCGRKGGRLPKLCVCKIQEERIICEKNTYSFCCKHWREFSRNLTSKFVHSLVTYTEEFHFQTLWLCSIQCLHFLLYLSTTFLFKLEFIKTAPKKTGMAEINFFK